MDDLRQLNISWEVIRSFLCNHSLTRMYKINVTCFNNDIMDNNDVHHHGYHHQDNRDHNNTLDDAYQTRVLSPTLLKVVVAGGIIFLLGIVLNTCLLLASSNKKRQLKSSWKYVRNLAVADIMCLLSAAGWILYIVSPASWSERLHSYLFPSLDIFLSSASMLSAAAIALDRQHTIRNFPKRTSNRGIRNPNVVIGMIWMYSMAMFGLSMGRIVETSETYEHTLFWVANTVSLFAAIFVTLTCYVIIVYYYVSYLYFNKHQVVATATGTKLLSSDDLVARNIEKTRREKEQRKKLRKIVITAMTPIPFVTGWAFFLGTQTFEVITQRYVVDVHYNIAMIVVPWCVSAVNPLMYILLTDSIRKQIRCYWRKVAGLTISKQKSLQCCESIQLTEV